MGTNWLDILISAIILGYAWMGFRTGLVGGLARLLGTLLGLAAALNFYRPLADTLNLKWNLVSAIKGLMPVPAIGSRVKPPGTDIFGPAGSGSQGIAPKGTIYPLQGLGDSVAGAMASGVLDIICFIAILLAVSWAVKILGFLAGKIAGLLFLGPLDRLGGTLLGAAKGAVLAAVLVALANSLQAPAAFLTDGRHSDWVGMALQKSVLAPYFIKGLVILNVKFPGWGI
ncbi:MAG: CvpA family protein [Peptococcaceae bacterium]|nr:CvpA family protein [Peptococcaceae bacterium]